MAINIINFENPTCNFDIRQLFHCLRPKLTPDKIQFSLDYDKDDTSNFPLDVQQASFFVVDKNLNYIHASGIPELDIQSKDMVGKNINDILEKDMASFFANIYKECFETKTLQRARLLINTIHTEVFVLPILSSVNDIYGGVLLRIPYKTVTRFQHERKETTIIFLLTKTYHVDFVSPKPYDDFLHRVSHQHDDRLASYNIVGKNYLEFMDGERIQGIYRQLFDLVFRKNTGYKTSYRWFCDSVYIERLLHMTITKVNPSHIELSSRIVSEVTLFYGATYLELDHVQKHEDGKTYVHLYVCSFCKRVGIPSKGNILQTHTRFPTEDVVILGNAGKKRGKTQEKRDSGNYHWLSPEYWSKRKKKDMDYYIEHELCIDCKEEWHDYLDKINN